MTIPIDRLKPDLSDYFSTSLADFYVRLDHRLLAYGMVFIFSSLCTFGALWCYEILFALYYQFPRSYTAMYAWHTAANFTLCVFVLDTLIALVPGDWGAYAKRTVGKTWVVFLIAFLAGFALQCTVVYQLIDLYAPKLILYYETYPAERPGAVLMFFYSLSYWLIIGYAVIRLILGIQARSEELLRVRVDTILEERFQPHKNERHAEPRETTKAETLPLPIDTGVGPIGRSQIGHVSVEDHYLRIHFCINGESRNTLIRMTLKELSGHLPADRFIRIHRSHIVNLEWIAGIKRMGRDVRLTVKHGDFNLPVSRYRLPQLLPVLDRFLEGSHQ